MKHTTHKIILLCLLLMFFFRSATASNITLTAYSGAGLPVQNITIAVSDELGYSYTNLTEANGTFTAYNVTGDNITIRLDYPSSAYTARIDYVNGTQKVFLGNVYGATLKLVNTLGQYLEGQDCSVAIYTNDTNQLIKRYDTQCRQGERYVDTSGNWASITNCPITDSKGNYYFTTKILEEDGFEYNRYYRTDITCNAQTGSTQFYVDVQKPPDVDMLVDWFVRYVGAALLLVIFAIFFVVIAASVIGLIFLGVRRLKRGS